MTEEIRICEKPFLTLKEAAVYTGLGINKLRELSNENNCDFVLFVGTKRLLKRERLLEFLQEPRYQYRHWITAKPRKKPRKLCKPARFSYKKVTR